MTSPPAAASAADLRPARGRADKRLVVLDLLSRTAPLSRSDVGRLTGYSRGTVSTVVKSLLGEGLVHETTAPAEGPGGRPPMLLRLAGVPGVLIGVDIGHRHVRVAVADLAAAPLAEEAVALDVDHAPTAALDTAAEMVARCLTEAGIAPSKVVGVGLGVPGPVDPRARTIQSAILPAWVGMAPAQELADRLGTEVRVDNDANVGALGELRHGAAQGVQDMVYVKVAGGIGAGLVLGGRLHRGVSGIAGELGHTRVDDDGPVCRCGNRGCLETLVGASTLVDLLQPAYAERLTVERLLELARAGDPGVNRILDDAGRSIGRVLANMSNHLNPAAIVVGGGIGTTDAMLRGIRDSIARYAQPDTAASLTVLPGRLRERAGVMGALALARDATAVASGQPASA